MTRNILSKPACQLLLIIIVGTLGYSNTLNSPFHFDDEGCIVKNPIIKNLAYYVTPSQAKIYKGAQEYPMLINRYIGSLTFALNYKIHGLKVTGYHIFNILIHLINSLLVYWFVLLIFKSLASGAGGDKPALPEQTLTIALFTSLLFVSHPIQTQAVTYIVQRFASLATTFYLLSIIMYIKFRLTFNDSNRDHGGKTSIRAFTFYLIALLTTVLAIKTKEIAFTLPAIIFLYEFIFFKGKTKSRILALIPFILTMLIIPATLIYCVDLGGSINTATRLETDIPRLDYLYTQFRIIITYLRLILFPIAQNLDYDYPIYHSVFEPEVLLSLMALLAICSTVIYFFFRYRITHPITKIILFGTAWFFVTISIESGIIPISDVIFEHRMYLPSSGIFLVISTLLLMAVDKCRQKWVAGAVFSTVIITTLVLTATTYARNKVWNDKIVLWQDVVTKSPGKARGYYNLAQAHTEKGNLDIAIKYYKKAISINPNDYRYHLSLGICLGDLDRMNEAIAELKEAVRINPHDFEAYNNLGSAFGALGLINESIKAFRKALQIEPDSDMARNNLEISLGRLSRPNELTN